jgi:hypothetical protein
MNGRQIASLDARTATHRVVLVDRACGACASCLAGATLWCLALAPEGRDLTPELPSEHLEALRDALLAVAALDTVPASATALLVRDPAGPAALLARALLDDRVVVAPDLATARERLVGEPLGRASVVVADADVAGAVRAVRRGGRVFVLCTDATMPSMTELVQREVSLLVPQDVSTVAGRIDPALWAAAAAAAA